MFYYKGRAPPDQCEACPARDWSVALFCLRINVVACVSRTQVRHVSISARMDEISPTERPRTRSQIASRARRWHRSASQSRC